MCSDTIIAGGDYGWIYVWYNRYGYTETNVRYRLKVGLKSHGVVFGIKPFGIRDGCDRPRRRRALRQLSSDFDLALHQRLRVERCKLVRLECEEHDVVLHTN